MGNFLFWPQTPKMGESRPSPQTFEKNLDFLILIDTSHSYISSKHPTTVQYSFSHKILIFFPKIGLLGTLWGVTYVTSVTLLLHLFNLMSEISLSNVIQMLLHVISYYWVKYWIRIIHI